MPHIPDYPGPTRPLDGNELLAAWQDSHQISMRAQALMELMVAENPAFKGANGAVGSSAGFAALFSGCAGMVIATGIKLLRTAGYAAAGIGGAWYIQDAAVDAAYVTANPLTSFRGVLDILGGTPVGFRLDPNQVLAPEMAGGAGDWNGSSGTDNYPAVVALTAIASFGNFGFPTWSFGPRIQFGVGNYHFSQTLYHTKTVNLVGQGTGSNKSSAMGPTVWTVPINTTPIVTENSDTTGTTNGSGHAAQGVLIEGFDFDCTGGTSTTAYGIWLRTKTMVRNCGFYNVPSHGIFLNASSGTTGATAGNANTCLIEHCFVYSCGGDAFHTEGTDSNACTFRAIEVGPSCKGCGIFDVSGLGNFWFGINIGSAGNGGVSYSGRKYVLIDSTAGIGAATTPSTNSLIWYDIGPGAPDAGFPAWSNAGTYKVQQPIFCQGDSTRSNFDGIYVEGGGVCHISGPAIASGGQCIFTIWSNHITYDHGAEAGITCRAGVGGRRGYSSGQPGYAKNGGYSWSGVGMQDPDDPVSPAILGFGRDAEGQMYTWAWTTNDQLFHYLNAKPIWQISGKNTARVFGRSVAVPHTISFTDMALEDPTNSNNARIMGLRSGAPANGSIVAAGEIYWDISAAAGGKAGYRVTTGGTVGSTAVLKQFAVIDA